MSDDAKKPRRTPVTKKTDKMKKPPEFVTVEKDETPEEPEPRHDVIKEASQDSSFNDLVKRLVQSLTEKQFPAGRKVTVYMGSKERLLGRFEIHAPEETPIGVRVLILEDMAQSRGVVGFHLDVMGAMREGYTEVEDDGSITLILR